LHADRAARRLLADYRPFGLEGPPVDHEWGRMDAGAPSIDIHAGQMLPAGHGVSG
jgi:hypothetical protein